jgi:hypothetical protein
MKNFNSKKSMKKIVTIATLCFVAIAPIISVAAPTNANAPAGQSDDWIEVANSESLKEAISTYWRSIEWTCVGTRTLANGQSNQEDVNEVDVRSILWRSYLFKNLAGAQPRYQAVYSSNEGKHEILLTTSDDLKRISKIEFSYTMGKFATVNDGTFEDPIYREVFSKKSSLIGTCLPK